MMEKLRGTTEQVAGKLTGNPELANRGDERKVCPILSSFCRVLISRSGENCDDYDTHLRALSHM